MCSRHYLRMKCMLSTPKPFTPSVYDLLSHIYMNSLQTSFTRALCSVFRSRCHLRPSWPSLFYFPFTLAFSFLSLSLTSTQNAEEKSQNCYLACHSKFRFCGVGLGSRFIASWCWDGRARATEVPFGGGKDTYSETKSVCVNDILVVIFVITTLELV